MPTPAWCRPANRGPCSCARRTVSIRRRSRRARRIRSRSGPSRADDISAFHPDIKIASARTWTVGFQRSISSNMAVEARYVGTRGVNQWSTLDYNELNVIENGFFDEFKLAMAQPAGEQHRRRQPRWLVRLFRSRHRHGTAADLSRVYRRPHRRVERCRLQRHDLDQHRADPGHGPHQSAAVQFRGRSRRRHWPVATTRSPPVCRRTSSSSIRTWTASASPTAARSATTTRCRSKSAAACRAD